MPLSRTLQGILESRTGARPVAVVRMFVGLAAALRGLEGGRLLWNVLSPETARMPYFEWVPAIPREAVFWLAGVWFAAGLAFLAGWRTRFWGSVLALVIVYVLALDQQTYASHLYLLLLILVLLTLADSGAAYSLDARRRGRRATVPGWPVWLLKRQLTIVYGFAALTKLNAEYLSGSVLRENLLPGLVRWIDASGYGDPLLRASAVLSILIEAFLAAGFLIPGWRRAAIWVGVAFHVAMVSLLAPEVALQLGIFALETLALYALFFEGKTAM